MPSMELHSYPDDIQIEYLQERNTLINNPEETAAFGSITTSPTPEIQKSLLKYDVSLKDYIDPSGPYQIHHKISSNMHQWEKVTPIPPLDFLTRLLSGRGYDILENPLLSTDFRRSPTDKELADYTTDIIVAVRNSKLDKLKELHEQGISMNACNKFGESIVHLACRRSSFEVVQFMLRNGGDAFAVDDFGRTPFHDACWRTDIRFDIIALLLKFNVSFLHLQDVRGAFALSYVMEDNWLSFCAFLYHQRDVYFPRKISGERIKKSNSLDTVLPQNEMRPDNE